MKQLLTILFRASATESALQNVEHLKSCTIILIVLSTDKTVLKHK